MQVVYETKNKAEFERTLKRWLAQVDARLREGLRSVEHRPAAVSEHQPSDQSEAG